MNDTLFTLQEFMLHTENVTYIILGLSLFAVLGFWLFLTGRDED